MAKAIKRLIYTGLFRQNNNVLSNQNVILPPLRTIEFPAKYEHANYSVEVYYCT